MEGLFGFLIRWHYLIKRDTTVWLKLLMDGDRETPRRFRIMVVCVRVRASLSMCERKRKSLPFNHVLCYSSFFSLLSFLSSSSFLSWNSPQIPPFPVFPAGSQFQAPCHPQSTQVSFLQRLSFFLPTLTVFNLPQGCMPHEWSCTVHSCHSACLELFKIINVQSHLLIASRLVFFKFYFFFWKVRHWSVQREATLSMRVKIIWSVIAKPLVQCTVQ